MFAKPYIYIFTSTIDGSHESQQKEILGEHCSSRSIVAESCYSAKGLRFMMLLQQQSDNL